MYVKGQRQPGQGGRRNPPGGRPTKEEAERKEQLVEIKKQASEIAKEFFEAHVQDFLDTYRDLGTGKVIERLDKDGKVVKLVMLDPATVRHAIDKILPDEQIDTPPATIITNFIQFTPGIPQRAVAVPAPILVGDGKQAKSEREESSQSLAPLPPPALKFHAFSNGKRREK